MSDVAPFSPPVAEALDSAILRVLMDTMPDRIYFKDRESRFVRVNLAQARNLGVKQAEDCIGKSDYDYFTPQHAAEAYADEQLILRTGVPVLNKLEFLILHDGSKEWVSTSKLVWKDEAGKVIGTFGLTRNVTATKQAEEKLTEERNLLRTIIDHLPSRIYVKDLESHYLLNNAAHLAMLGAPNQEAATGRTLLDFFPGERGRNAIADDQQVIQSGVPILNQERSAVVAGGETKWSLTTKVPLRDIRKQIVGLVGVSHDITRRKLAEEEVQHRTAEMEADVRMARQLQELLISRPYPVFPAGVPAEASALRFAHRYLPATTLGGDFFDIIHLSDTQCGLLVCDVMGHGVRAGLLTALIRGVVEEMGERATQPAQVLAAINNTLCPILEQTGQPMFATAFFGVFDTSTGTLTYANAGHPPPVLARTISNTLERLALPNPEPATGLIAQFTYSNRATRFNPGDRLLAYTDGLIEAADRNGTFFGEDRVCFLLGSCATTDVERTCEHLVNEAKIFTGHAGFEDDVCIVVVESTGATCMLEPLNYHI